MEKAQAELCFRQIQIILDVTAGGANSTHTQRHVFLSRTQASQTMMSCMPCISAGGPDLTALFTAGTEATKLAEELRNLSTNTQTRGNDVVGFAQEIKATFSGLDSKMNASTFQTIAEMLKGDRMKDTIALSREMDDLAIECVSKSKAMVETVSRASQDLPASVKGGGLDMDIDAQTEEERNELRNLDGDITDLEECTNDLRTMNLFSAAINGTRAFDGLAKKGGMVQTTYERIKELCAMVARASQNLVSEACCSQMQAGIESIKAMLKSVQLSNLINKLAEAAKRLINAIKDLVVLAWEKIQNFAEQFQAGKKIKNWVNGLSPLNSTAGNVLKQGAQIMEGFTGQGAGTGRNTLFC
jgi:hypothetical protein